MIPSYIKIKKLLKNKQEKINIVTGIEFETGRTIDGKKEYGKRIDVGQLPNATAKEIETGLENVSFTYISGIAIYEYGVSIPIPLVEKATDSQYNIGLKITNYGQTIRISCDKDQNVFTGYVTLYYTKN